MTRTSTQDRPAAKVVRCALYTRKSTDEGLDQEFNSLAAQREAAEAFVASQRAEGWHCLADRYYDGGFTGGNTDRPFRRRRLAEAQAKQIWIPRRALSDRRWGAVASLSPGQWHLNGSGR